jgi:hypothetical protein
MRCVNHAECNSIECPHRPEHDFMAGWCNDGSCKWAKDTRCVEPSKREQLAALMMTDEWGKMTDAKAIDAIMEIFGEEGTNE